MNKFLTTAFTLPCLLLSNCATIISRSNYPVTVNSQPQGLSFVVTNLRDNTVVSQGVSPQQVVLKSGGGYFRPAHYRIDVKKSGKVVASQNLDAGFNGWYVGNIVFGGLIGLLIVDPLTGAMYRLPENATVSAPAIATLNQNGKSLQVVSIDHLTPTQRQQLVKL